MASNNNPIIKSIRMAREGKKFPVLQLVRESPELAAIVSKLNISNAVQSTYNSGGQRQIQNPDVFQLRQLAHRMGRNTSDAETVMEMLPDMELSAQILVSSILSPKDMMSTEINFVAPEGLTDPQTTSELILILRRHFDQVYKIKPSLSKILRDILFDCGSHVRAVIPENSIDDLINHQNSVTMENLSEFLDSDNLPRSLGVLGPSDGYLAKHPDAKKQPHGFSFESLGHTYSFTTNPGYNQQNSKLYLSGGTFPVINPTREQVDTQKDRRSFESITDEYVTVTDNVSVLKFPALAEKIKQQQLSSAYRRKSRTSLESQKDPQKLSDREMTTALYKPTAAGYRPVVVAKTQEQLKRRTVGGPMILELPQESVIPVHVPGQEDKHIGYFVLLDVHGNPISRKNQRDSYGELADRMSNSSGGSNQFASQLIQRVSNLMNGFDGLNSQHLDYSAKVYAEMVESDLLSRLRNGVYTNGVALARNEEVYRIMLARTLSAQHTQLLFLPVELVTYFAFRYTANGTGKSLMDGMKILNSLRTMLMFSDTMASIRNSIGLTDVKIKLDEHDPDPYKTIERVMGEILRAKQQAFPLGQNSPVDIVNYLQRAGYDFSWENHPGLPDIGIEKNERAQSYPKSDDTLSENLRKRTIMATGLNPETVDNGFNGEFATSVVHNNILLSRRILQIQELFCPQLSDHLRKVVFATEGLIEELKEVIARNFDENNYDLTELKKIHGEDVSPEQLKTLAVERIFKDFVSTTEVELPRPSVTTTVSQTQDLEDYIKLLDMAIDAWISAEFMTSNTAGDAGNVVEDMKKSVRAFFIRQFMSENNILPELGKITRTDEDGKPDQEFWGNVEGHSEILLKAIAAFIHHTKKTREASDVVLKDASGDKGFDSFNPGNSSSNEPSSSDAGGFGSDNFGFDETPPSDTTEGTPEEPSNADNTPNEESPSQSTPPSEEQQ